MAGHNCEAEAEHTEDRQDVIELHTSLALLQSNNEAPRYAREVRYSVLVQPQLTPPQPDRYGECMRTIVHI